MKNSARMTLLALQAAKSRLASSNRYGASSCCSKHSQPQKRQKRKAQMIRLARSTYFVTLLAIVAAIASPCRAGTILLPSAVFTGNVNNITIYAPGTYTSVNYGGPGAIDTTTMKEFYRNGYSMISASGSAAPYPYHGSSGAGGVVSYFFIVSGSKSELVPLIFTGKGSTSATGFTANAWAAFETPAGTLAACSVTATSGSSCGSVTASSFSSTLQGNVIPGTIYEIDVAIMGSTTGGTTSGGSWAANVDPEVMIDPSFADKNLFSLQFSPLGASEPSSISLLSLSCAAVIASFRSARARRPGAAPGVKR